MYNECLGWFTKVLKLMNQNDFPLLVKTVLFKHIISVY
jgi:hypothetical protein